MEWWSKFNYVTSAALDSGTVLSLITIFFTLQFPKGGGISLNWWGNSVYIDSESPLSFPTALFFLRCEDGGY